MPKHAEEDHFRAFRQSPGTKLPQAKLSPHLGHQGTQLNSHKQTPHQTNRRLPDSAPTFAGHGENRELPPPPTRRARSPQAPGAQAQTGEELRAGRREGGSARADA